MVEHLNPRGWPEMRVGRKVGRTLYFRTGPESSDADELIGMVDSRDLADEIVRRWNKSYDLSHGDSLLLAASRVVMNVGPPFDVVTASAGSFTGDALAHSIAMVKGCRWVTVRLTDKDRGTERGYEGARLAYGSPVLLLEMDDGDVERSRTVLEKAGCSVIQFRAKGIGPIGAGE